MENIIDDITAVGLALYIDKNLILSDVHLGYEEAINKQGILLPRTQFRDILLSLEDIFRQLKGSRIDRIIINGDLKHEFGKISETEWRHTIRLLDYLGKRCREVILIKGNHDTVLGPIAKKRNVIIKDNLKIGDILVVHGDKLPKASLLKDIKTIIIGHEHPAITLKDGPRTEKFKCIMKGRWKNFNLLVQPSFHPLLEGTDITKEEVLSPFLKRLDDFEIFIVADNVYDFGKLKNLNSHTSL